MHGSLILRGGHALVASLGLGAIASIAAVIALQPEPPPTQPAPAPPSPSRALLELGIGPDLLGVLGVDEQTIRAIVAASKGFVATRGSAIAQHDGSIDQAAALAASLRQRLNRGEDSQELRAQLQAAEDDLAAARALRTAVLDELRTTAIAAIPQDCRTLLERAIANARVEVPVSYRLGERSEAQWVALRDALAQRATAQRTGAALPDAHRDIIQAAEADPPVAAALANVSAGAIDSARAAWNDALR